MSHYDHTTGLVRPDPGEIPAVGTPFEFTVYRRVPCTEVSYTYGSHTVRPHDPRGCRQYAGHLLADKVTAPVTKVMHWADNSIEVYGEGGLKHELIPPNGDAC